MSADNYILVKENKKNYKVMMKCASTKHQMGRAVKCQGLRNAVKEAVNQSKETEYGIYFDLREKKLNDN